MNQYNAEGKKEGYWEEFYLGVKFTQKGNYINGLRDGWWEWYCFSGRLSSKGNYINGKEDGWWEYYKHQQEIIIKKEFHVNI